MYFNYLDYNMTYQWPAHVILEVKTVDEELLIYNKQF